ncbi:hypothetical protein [Micromonospora zamorensis]|uniref:hypothetical protein n=1 Tax=Micromonospora zamorensis TaxID=709883 RepID=UPI002E29D309|nr:hypothetical protein [Micromonospora zamorensis]
MTVAEAPVNGISPCDLWAGVPCPDIATTAWHHVMCCDYIQLQMIGELIVWERGRMNVALLQRRSPSAADGLAWSATARPTSTRHGTLTAAGMTVDVTVIAAFLLVCGVALMVCWIVVASAFGGTLLWAVQWKCVSSGSFRPIRLYGLSKGGRKLLRSAAGPGAIRRLVARESWRRVLLLLMVPLVGFMVPVSLPYAVRLLVPASMASGALADTAARVSLLTGTLGAVVALRVFLNGLRYIAQPDKARGKLPALRFPDDLSVRGRDRVAANAFWFTMAHTVEVLAVMYPVVALAAAVPGVVSSPGEAQVDDAAWPPLLGIIVVFLALMPLVVPAHFAASRLRRRLAGWELSVEICQSLTPPDEENRDDSLQMPETLRPLADAHRNRLVDIVVLLDQTAVLWDRRQPQGFVPHPAATMLRAVSASIRRHLQSPHSCQPATPSDLRETLRKVLDLLVEPDQTSAMRELACRVQAFDEDGRPTIETFVRPPSRLAVTITKLTDGAQRTAAVLAALAGMAATFIAVALAIVGKIDSDALLGHLK